MCDSDEDEFLSASEGEYNDFEEKEKSKRTHPQSEKESEEMKQHEEEKKNESELHETEPILEEKVKEVVEKEEKEELQLIVDTASSQESLLDEKHFSASVSSTSESQADSLSSEKQRLLEEVVKETMSDIEEKTSTQEEALQPRENATDSEKSLDEGGWDDFDVETSPSEDKKAEETPKNIEVKKEKKMDEKRGEEWDDWEEDSKKQKSTDGWNDWSLIDEKKVQEATSQKKETDPWFQEQLGAPQKTAEKKTGWGWTGIVSAVGETFSSTIESSLGLPSAEEVARQYAKHQKEMPLDPQEEQEEVAAASSTAPPLVTGFGMLSGLVSGGMDVLESIGKKTFEAVTVKDDKGGGRRRMIFTEESGQNLSDVLRELREKEDREIPFQMGSTATSKQLPDVASQFGRSEGMAHLEALEMLSNSRPKASPKFERQFISALTDVDSERVEDGDFGRLLSDVLKRINLPYEPKALIDCDNEIANRLAWCDGKSADELFSDSNQSLVEFTAASVHIVSKLANLLLILRQDVPFQEFVSLFSLLAQRANFIASQYTDNLSTSSDTAKVDELTTQILVECSTAVDFIRQAHRLLCPMFQNL